MAVAPDGSEIGIEKKQKQKRREKKERITLIEVAFITMNRK